MKLQTIAKLMEDSRAFPLTLRIAYRLHQEGFDETKWILTPDLAKWLMKPDNCAIAFYLRSLRVGIYSASELSKLAKLSEGLPK